MAARKPNTSASTANKLVDTDEKIARLLGLLLVKDMPSTIEQATLLRTAGFQVAEVAEMLHITENHVNVATFAGRKRTKKPKGSAKK